MKCRMQCSPSDKKVIDQEIKAHFLREWDVLAKALDACYLLELHTNPKTRFGKKRLKEAWRRIVAENHKLRERYELKTTDDLAFATQRELKRIGVDLDEWYREYERERHR